MISHIGSKEGLMLFRGDSGLPIGMLPLSPYMRRLVWQGYTLQEAYEACERHIDYLYTTWNESHPNTVRNELLWFSDINHYQNPFVSTTKFLRKAIEYATRRFTTDRGYVSIIWTTENRCIPFTRYLNLPSIQEENEFGINSFILPKEILWQVPIKSIDPQMYLTEADNENLIISFMDTYAKEKFRFKWFEEKIILCPRCHTPLSNYLCEILGFDSGALRLYKKPIAKDKINSVYSDDPYAGRFKGEDEVHFDALAKHGMIARCEKCKQYMYLPERHDLKPLEIVEQSYERNTVILIMQNKSDEAIFYFVLKVSWKKNGEFTSDYIQQSLIAATEDFTFWTPKPTRGRKAYEKIYEKQKKEFSNKVLPPNACLTYKLDLEFDPQKQPNFKVRVDRVHFLSGKSWLSPEY